MTQMSENTFPEPERVNSDPSVFKLEVVIGDLPYVFEGAVPEAPDRLLWTVSVPDWAVEKAKIDEQIRSGEVDEMNYNRLLSRLRASELGEGTVGMIAASPAENAHGVPALLINRIETAHGYLPDNSPYHDAHGVGSFLLDSLGALADGKGWRIYLFPDDRGGRLDQAELYEWYMRHGFHDGFDDTGRPGNEMVRMPGEPDISLPIATLLD